MKIKIKLIHILMQLSEVLGAGRVNFETKSPNCSIGSIQHDDILIVYFCGRVGKASHGWLNSQIIKKHSNY